MFCFFFVNISLKRFLVAQTQRSVFVRSIRRDQNCTGSRALLNETVQKQSSVGTL